MIISSVITSFELDDNLHLLFIWLVFETVN